MIRLGRVIGLKSEKIEEYKKYHAEVWPEVLDKITEYNIHNYSIFYRDGMLFSYFEYTGSNYEEEMQKMASEPVVCKWRELMAAMQVPLYENGKLWTDMEVVFHHD
jgi:L-rhamnose mutarotase